MPRPDKQIDPGQLDGPVSSPRAQSWTKYGGAETVEGHRGAPSSDDPVIVEVTVDDITVTDYPDGMTSKYTTRGTAAHGIGLPPEDLINTPVRFVTEWVIDRTVEGRTYHRTDRLVMVQLEG
jgi:hypothetical protein